ncbi:substrate-binding domain-containing protein [Rhizobium sp. BK376]|uniref:substrate-binding domain-containing protein n=1 Tax=Rhizobium sp. BK376 TaxID=2512149 RepID=UPI001404A338|nr:substrate-binding domain-containing protein [Rhizobium sp. BK376]
MTHHISEGSRDCEEYASKHYVDRWGIPVDESDLTSHHFVAPDNPAGSRAPVYRWLSTAVPSRCISYRATDTRAVYDAVIAGAGLGFLPTFVGQSRGELVEILPSRGDWISDIWLVTHVDLHRTFKVQKFLEFIKAAAPGGPACSLLL